MSKKKRWLRWLQKDMAKGYGMKRKELFGSKAPQTGYSIAFEYYKEREKQWIQQTRDWIEEDFKAKYPEYKDLKFGWRDYE